MFVFFPCHDVYFFPCQFVFWCFLKIDTFSCNSCNFKIFVSPCRIHFLSVSCRVFCRVLVIFLCHVKFVFVSCSCRIAVSCPKLPGLPVYSLKPFGVSIIIVLCLSSSLLDSAITIIGSLYFLSSLWFTILRFSDRKSVV